MFYSRASEALFLFIRLLLAGSVAYGTYPSKTAAGGIINLKEVLTDLFCVIAVGLADEPDGIWQQDMPICFLRFVFLPLFVFLVCDLLHGGYLAFWSID